MDQRPACASGLDSSRDTLHLLRATLAQIRDHLGHNEVAQLSAQLPLFIRGMFFKGWQPAHTPIQDRALDYFVAAIAANIGDVKDWRGTEDIQIVMRLLNAKITESEIADVKAGLPTPICDLWPD